MNRIFWLLVAITSLTFSVIAAKSIRRADVGHQGTIQESGLYPDRTHHDCGERGQGDVIREQFEFVNTHDAVATVLEISRGCSCNESSVTRQEIPPGERTTLNCSWNLGLKRGPIFEEMAILYRVGNQIHASQFVKLKALVNPDVIYEPCPLPAFQPGIASKIEIQFRPGRVQEFELKNAFVNQRTFLCKAIPERSSIELEYTPSTPSSEGQGIYLSVTTGTKNEPEIRIPITFATGKEERVATPGGSQSDSTNK